MIDRIPLDSPPGADAGLMVDPRRPGRSAEPLSHRAGRPVVAMSAAPAVPGGQPQGGAHLVGTVPLDVRARCLLGAGDTVVVGYDDGLLALRIGTFR